MKVDKRLVASTMITIAVILAIILCSPQILKTDVPFAVVSSWSMDPTLHIGDLIVVMGTEQINPGDIIVYSSWGGRLIVHRVVRVEVANGVAYYVTKGDANPVPDLRPVTRSEVKGKVIFVIPYIGVVKLAAEALMRLISRY